MDEFKSNSFRTLATHATNVERIIQTGKLCGSCATELRKEIDLHEKEEQRKEELLKQTQRTYLSKNK